MNILLVVPDTVMGGITSAAINFCNEMVNRGHGVTFLNMSVSDPPHGLDKRVRVERLHGVEAFWNITATQKQGLPWLLHKSLGFLKKLTIRSGCWYNLIFRKTKNRITFDLAIAFRQCAPCYFYVLKRINAKAKMGFVHGELTYMGDISSWQKYMSSFDKIAYVSDAVRKQFVSKYPDLDKNACTVYNMFSSQKIIEMSELPSDIKIDPQKKCIVTVARVDNNFKQIQWIVDICARLKVENVPCFHWYVVGGGPDYEDTVRLSIEKKVDDVLTFLGDQSNPFSIVKQADFTVLTSKSEAYPMTVIESFILKKPLIVSEFPAIGEMMEHGKHGLIAQQSVESLAQCVRQFLENQDGIYSTCANYLEQYLFSNDTPYHQLITALEK